MKAVKMAALWACVWMCGLPALQAQETSGDLIDLSLASTYKIAGLTVLGAEHTDVQAIKLFSSLQVGQEIEIPGDALKRAITGL